MGKITIPFIVKNERLAIKVGQYNGYVAVSPESRFHGLTYYASLVRDLDVHGGITFSEPVINGEHTIIGHIEIKKEFVGKRSPVAKNAIRLDGINDPIPEDWWILGFDTMHFNDSPKKWDEKSVSNEVYHLERQITLADDLLSAININDKKD